MYGPARKPIWRTTGTNLRLLKIHIKARYYRWLMHILMVRSAPLWPETDLFHFTTAEKASIPAVWSRSRMAVIISAATCIVPSVKRCGRKPSVKDILSIYRGDELGFKKWCWPGFNISRYEYEGTRFEKSDRKNSCPAGNFRMRISSLEPDRIGDGFMDLFSQEKLCSHLHLCFKAAVTVSLKKWKGPIQSATIMHLSGNYVKNNLCSIWQPMLS